MKNYSVHKGHFKMHANLLDIYDKNNSLVYMNIIFLESGDKVVKCDNLQNAFAI